ncbi:MAG: FIVAR domain-containing protein, partial [Ruminococcus sp.]|nr:FIVAR domain-containing protein [Ruminococcus sp.]
RLEPPYTVEGDYPKRTGSIEQYYDLCKERKTENIAKIMNNKDLASGEKYTEESALRLQNAIDSANEMYIKEDATEEELTAEVTSLENAMNMMEVVTVSEEVRVYLAGVIALADSEVLEEKDYTPESWEVFKKAYDEAVRVQAKGESDEEFISAADALGEAMEKLESADAELQKARAELMSLIEYTVTEDIYTAQSLARFENAKSEATAVYNDENATYEDIQAQIKSMEDAISGLELIPETSLFKENLALWIASADEVENSDVFSADVWAQFADSYENAKSVYDTEASDEVFIQAAESLRNAMDSLMIQAREALMGQLQRTLDDGVNYTDESLENLSDAISKGWKVYNNKDAELAEVLNGVKQISEAFDLLEVVTVSPVAVQTHSNVIEKADAKFPQKDSYTEESWQNFKTAYDSAVITLHFGKSDAEFYLCAQTLQSAMDALEVKPEPPASPDEIFVLLGDADGNGKVNIKDATYVQKCVAGITNLSDNGKYTADSNADGKINVKDATEIQKFLAGLNANENIGTYIPVEL